MGHGWSLKTQLAERGHRLFPPAPCLWAYPLMQQTSELSVHQNYLEGLLKQIMWTQYISFSKFTQGPRICISN